MSSVIQGVPERRRAPRAPARLHLVYAKGSLDEARRFRDLRHGFILDLSYGGAQAALMDRFPAGTRLGVFIMGELGEIQAEAEVVWSWNVSETEGVAVFEHGLKFLSRSPQLDQFVHLATCA